MKSTLSYQFSGELWQHAGTGGWHFVSLPREISFEIRAALKSEEEGWGRLKATAILGDSRWQTAVWYDTQASCYLLPVKAEIRKKERLVVGQTVAVGVFL